MDPYIDLSRLQLRDRLRHPLLQQILHGTDPDQGELLLNRLRRLGQPRLAARECRGSVVELGQPRLGLPLVEGALGEHERAQPLRGEVRARVRVRVRVRLRLRLRVRVRVRVRLRVRVGVRGMGRGSRVH